MLEGNHFPSRQQFRRAFTITPAAFRFETMTTGTRLFSV